MTTTTSTSPKATATRSASQPTTTLSAEAVASLRKRLTSAAKSLGTADVKFEAIVREAREVKLWQSTGHESFPACMAAVLAIDTLNRAALETVIVQSQLSDLKLSGRKIAEALGVDQKRVSRALSAAKADGRIPSTAGGQGGGQGGTRPAAESDAAESDAAESVSQADSPKVKLTPADLSIEQLASLASAAIAELRTRSDADDAAATAALAEIAAMVA